SGVLGLDDVTNASEHLRRRRLEAEKPLKEVRKRLKDQLLVDLARSDDPRATAATAALAGRQWDLDGAAALAAGGAAASEAVPDGLAALSRLTVPPADQIEAAATRIEAAARSVA